MITSQVEYEIKGIKLDIEITTFDLAMAVGYEVRELIRRYEYDELYAIDYALSRRR